MPTCMQCGKHFESRRGSARYCGQRCSQQAYKARKRAKTPAAPLTLVCCICGKTFAHVPTNGGKIPSCCGPECSRKKELERKQNRRHEVGFGLSFDPYAQPDFYAFCAFGRSALPASHPTLCPMR